MTLSTPIRQFALITWLVSAGSVGAQMSGMRPSTTQPELDESAWVEDLTAHDMPERKRPSFWHRPSEASATGQLARALSFERNGSRRAATRAYNALVHRWHTAPEALEAQLGVARMCEARGADSRAFDEYQYLLAHFGDRLPSQTILERQLAIADRLRDSGSRDRACEMYEQIGRLAPQWPGSRAALLQAALIHEADKEYDQAATLCDQLLSRAPDSAEAASAAYHASECRYRLALRYDRDEAVALQAISALSVALRDYPEHADQERARQQLEDLKARRTARLFEAAAFYERVRRDPVAAAAAYREFVRRFPDSPEAQLARQRLGELTPTLPSPTQIAPTNALKIP